MSFLAALGCPVPEAPPGGSVRHQGDDAVVFCKNDSSMMWRLRCVDSRWVGTPLNCSAGACASPVLPKTHVQYMYVVFFMIFHLAAIPKSSLPLPTEEPLPPLADSYGSNALVQCVYLHDCTRSEHLHALCSRAGLIVAILVGVAIGILCGVLLLCFVLLIRRRSVSS